MNIHTCEYSQPCVVAAEKCPGWQSRQCYPNRIKQRKEAGEALMDCCGSWSVMKFFPPKMLVSHVFAPLKVKDHWSSCYD